MILLRFLVYLVVVFCYMLNVRRGKSLIGISVAASCLLPDIYGIDPSNFILFILIFIVVQRSIYIRKIILSKEVLIYIFYCSLIFMIQILSWIIKNPVKMDRAFISSFSVLRYPIIISLLYMYESSNGITRNIALDEIYNSISIINIANILASILQKINKNVAFALFRDWYSYSGTYVSELSHVSRYYRVYGTWNSAVTLGVYALISLAILFYIRTKRNKKLWILNVICSGLLGVFSLTKTFFIGIVIFMIFEYVLYLYYFIKNSCLTVTKIIQFLLFMLAGISFIFSIDYFYEWSKYNWSHLHFYLGCIYHPISAFSSRLSSNGTLAKTLEVIKENLLIGVGPLPIAGELVGDNAYIVLLHNGGLMSLFITILLFGRWFFKGVYTRDREWIIVLLIWLACGLSLPVLMTYKVCLLPGILYIFVKGGWNNEVCSNDGKASGCRWN